MEPAGSDPMLSFAGVQSKEPCEEPQVGEALAIEAGAAHAREMHLGPCVSFLVMVLFVVWV